MDFLSLWFLAFACAAILLTKFSRTKQQQNIVILIANILFYLVWSAKFLFLLLAEGIALFFVYKKMSDTSIDKIKKCYLSVGVSVSIIVLAIFKYYNFFISNLTDVGINLRGLSIVAPIGISFYTFMLISFIVDVYKGKIDKKIGIVEMLDYCLFFPTIVSGPITKARDLIPQFKCYREVNTNKVQNAICRFTIGAFKKVVIADRLAIYVDAVFKTPTVYSWLTLALASIAYSIQLYCDFAGYSDMAIAVAEAMGIEICENFCFPYLSKNPTEFWKRWHISLSSWLQEYLYISLGGNRKGKIRTYINLIITMILGGLWHGANWTFILWGTIHGVALVIHKLFANLLKKYELTISVLGECKRQVLFHKFWHLIFHKKRQLNFHTYLVFYTRGFLRGFVFI